MFETYLQNHFDRVGYYKMTNALDQESVVQLKKSIDEEFKNPDKSQKNFFNETGETTKIYGAYQRNRLNHELKKAITAAKIKNTINILLGPNVVLALNRHNHITTNRKGEQDLRFHRDILQPTRGLLSLIIYLDPADIESGCTQVIPGSHRETRVGVPQFDGGGTWLSRHDQFRHLQDQSLPVPVSAGDALVFDGLLFHAPGENTTERSRTSITFGLRAHDELSEIDDSRNVLVYGSPIYRGNDA
jgi:ectoine hydroxylase-related dioxygenase (phytanoyl-CoA dioxygenase family)